MANIVRNDPLSDIARFDPFRDIEDFFSGRRMRSPFRDMPEAPEIKMDVSEDEKTYRIKAEIPGVKKEDIRVSIDGGNISIVAEVTREKEEKKGETLLRSERYFGSQSRAFTLRHEIDQNGAAAKYQDGILELTLPKKNTATIKHLPIQ